MKGRRRPNTGRPDFLAAFGARVRTARKAAGIRQEDLGEAAGMSRSAICNVEDGRSGVTLDRLPLLCRACGVSADVLLGIGPMPERFALAATSGAEVLRLRREIRRLAAELRAVAEPEALEEAA